MSAEWENSFRNSGKERNAFSISDQVRNSITSAKSTSMRNIRDSITVAKHSLAEDGEEKNAIPDHEETIQEIKVQNQQSPKKNGISKKRKGLSKEEINEFNIAFSMCTREEGPQESIHKAYISDIFLTLGYSPGKHTIEKLLDICPADSENMISLEMLIEAYDEWRHEDIPDIDYPAMNALFRRISVETSDDNNGVSGDVVTVKKGTAMTGEINDRTIKELLIQVCHNEDISIQTAQAVIAEVDRTGYGHIDYHDFERMIKLQL